MGPNACITAKRLTFANKDLFKEVNSTGGPLFSRRGSVQLAKPVWRDNKCALDSLLITLLAIRVNMKENPLFSNDRGLLLMTEELPALTNLIDKFLVADISNL